ncbi:hypothetical protein JCM9743_28780 [Natrinema sp. JCM 9743]
MAGSRGVDGKAGFHQIGFVGLSLDNITLQKLAEEVGCSLPTQSRIARDSSRRKTLASARSDEEEAFQFIQKCLIVLRNIGDRKRPING